MLRLCVLESGILCDVLLDSWWCFSTKRGKIGEFYLYIFLKQSVIVKNNTTTDKCSGSAHWNETVKDFDLSMFDK